MKTAHLKLDTLHPVHTHTSILSRLFPSETLSSPSFGRFKQHEGVCRPQQPDLRATLPGSPAPFTFGGLAEAQRPILAVHPSEGPASRPAEQRPMRLGGSPRPGQAESRPAAV